jgi:hypothetical protein
MTTRCFIHLFHKRCCVQLSFSFLKMPFGAIFGGFRARVISSEGYGTSSASRETLQWLPPRFVSEKLASRNDHDRHKREMCDSKEQKNCSEVLGWGSRDFLSLNFSLHYYTATLKSRIILLFGIWRLKPQSMSSTYRIAKDVLGCSWAIFIRPVTMQLWKEGSHLVGDGVLEIPSSPGSRVRFYDKV